MLSLAGCGEGPREFAGEKAATSPVSGVVTVNGEPVLQLSVKADPVGEELEGPITALTRDDGSFAFSTYSNEDGLVPGKYTLTFYKMVPSLPDPYDQYGGQFADSSTSTHQITVEADTPLEIDAIDLKTQ